jgi:hypothetical protein
MSVDESGAMIPSRHDALHGFGDDGIMRRSDDSRESKFFGASCLVRTHQELEA